MEPKKFLSEHWSKSLRERPRNHFVETDIQKELFMDVKCSESQEKDINDVFDSIAFSEEQINNEAFQEGLIKGHEEGMFGGYHLGYHRGLQFGTEIGFYKGLIKVLHQNIGAIGARENEKIQKLLEKLTYLLNNFPKNNSENIDLLKDIGDIRATYRKLNSLLKLNISFPVTHPMSF